MIKNKQMDDMKKTAVKSGAFTISNSGAKRIDFIKLLQIKEWREHIENLINQIK